MLTLDNADYRHLRGSIPSPAVWAPTIVSPSLTGIHWEKEERALVSHRPAEQSVSRLRWLWNDRRLRSLRYRAPPLGVGALRSVRHSALSCALQCAGTIGSPPRQWRHADTGASHAKQ